MEYWRGVLQGSQGGAAGVGAVLHRHGLPKRLADALCHEAAVTATPLAQLKKVKLSPFGSGSSQEPNCTKFACMGSGSSLVVRSRARGHEFKSRFSAVLFGDSCLL